MRSRFLSVLKKYFCVIGIGFAYLIWIIYTDIKIPCILKCITGYSCPACGVTRMFIAIVRLDWETAYCLNPFLFITSPIILFCLIYSEIKYIILGNRNLGKFTFLLWFEIISALLFGLIRNF